MLELAASALITASSAFLFCYWCYQAYRLMRFPAPAEQHESVERLAVSLSDR